jgi:hypothetical protein
MLLGKWLLGGLILALPDLFDEFGLFEFSTTLLLLLSPWNILLCLGTTQTVQEHPTVELPAAFPSRNLRSRWKRYPQ